MTNALPKPHTLAFVSDAIYPYNKGGKETRLYEITTRLAQKGYDVHIYCMQWWKGKADRVENGVQLHSICPLIPLYDGPRRSIKQGIIFGLACFKLLWANFDVVDVDHMPFFPLYSMRIVCWLKGKPMNATWHEVWGMTYWREYLGGIKGTIAGWIEAISVKLPDTIYAVSHFTAKRLKNDLNYQGKMLVIPNGVDLEKIQTAQKSPQSSDVIYAGRLLKHKNVDVLIAAIGLTSQQQPKIRALIVGDGPEKKALKALVKKLKLEKNITFLPFEADIQNLYGLMKASKVFVLPSSREGFGLTVIEANACGLPVITVNEPANAAQELVRGGNGVVTELKNNKIHEAIQKVLKKSDNTLQFKFSDYDWSKVTKEFEEIFKSKNIEMT